MNTGPGMLLLLACLTVIFLVGPPTTELQAQAPDDPPRVALVLAGGAALGFAHVGVIRAIEEAGVEPDIIIGTSMGSVVGGLYAAGYSGDELTELVLTTDWRELLFDTYERNQLSFAQRLTTSYYPVTLPLFQQNSTTDAGVSQAQQIVELLDRLLADYPAEIGFDSLPRQFRAIATDLISGERVVYGEGDLKTVLRASMAIPGVFTPVYYRERYLIDGGWSDNTPTEVAAGMGAEIVITVALENIKTNPEELTSIAAVSLQAVEFIKRDPYGSDRELSDLYITPDLSGFTFTDFEKGDELIALGYQAGSAAIESLEEIAARQGPATERGHRLLAVPIDEPISIGEIRLAANTSTTDTRSLLKLLKDRIPDEIEADKLREIFSSLYDTGRFTRAWYRLIPQGEKTYLLEADIAYRKPPGALLGFGLDYEGQIIENSLGYGSLNAGYAHLLGPEEGERRSALAAEVRISEMSSINLSFLLFPNPGLLLTSSFYILQSPLYYLDDEAVQALYARTRIGTSLALTVPAGDYLAFGVSPYAEYRILSRRYGERLIENDYWNRFGAAAFVGFDSLDSAIIPERGLLAGLRINSAVEDGEELIVSGEATGWLFLPAGTQFRISPWLETGLLFLGDPREADTYRIGGSRSLEGYYPQEIGVENYLILGLSLRRRLLSLPMGTGSNLYLKLNLNGATVWSGAATSSCHEISHLYGGSAGLSAETRLGEFSLSVGINRDARLMSTIALRSSLPIQTVRPPVTQ